MSWIITTPDGHSHAASAFASSVIVQGRDRVTTTLVQLFMPDGSVEYLLATEFTVEWVEDDDA